MLVCELYEDWNFLGIYIYIYILTISTIPGIAPGIEKEVNVNPVPRFATHLYMISEHYQFPSSPIKFFFVYTYCLI